MAQQKSFDEALSLIEQILHEDPKNESAQVLKVQIGVHSKNSEIMESALKSLVGIAPINLQYSITLAQLYLDNDEARRAPEVFESLLPQFQHPDLYFNYAWFITRAAEYKKALINYQKAIDLGLQGSEEVHLNMANIYSSWLFSPDLAKKHLIDQAQGLKSIFNHDTIQTLWQEHQNESADHSALLWSMLMFEMWWVKYAQPQAIKNQQDNAE